MMEVLPEIVKMWTEHTCPGHEGEHFSTPPRVVQPKPLQDPHPPLRMACTQPTSVEMAAAHGTDDESTLEYGVTFFFHAPKRLRIRR